MEKIYLIPPPSGTGDLPFRLSLSGITYPDPNYGIQRKRSGICVVEYIVSGSGTVIYGGEKQVLKKGDAYLLSAGKEHMYFSDKKDPWEKKWMNVSGELCKNLVELYGLGRTFCFHDTDIEYLFDELFEFLDSNSDGDKINNFGAITFHKILQRFSANLSGNDISAASKVKSYIDTNIYARINARSVADRFGFSVSQLGRLFKSDYNTTVYSYILDQKISAAEKLLKNSSLPVKEIADMLNFTDEHYFCNIFKKKRGISPGKIRK